MSYPSEGLKMEFKNEEEMRDFYEKNPRVLSSDRAKAQRAQREEELKDVETEEEKAYREEIKVAFFGEKPRRDEEARKSYLSSLAPGQVESSDAQDTDSIKQESLPAVDEDRFGWDSKTGLPVFEPTNDLRPDSSLAPRENSAGPQTSELLHSSPPLRKRRGESDLRSYVDDISSESLHSESDSTDSMSTSLSDPTSSSTAISEQESALSDSHENLHQVIRRQSRKMIHVVIKWLMRVLRLNHQPFKFKKRWLKNEDFLAFIERDWDNLTPEQQLERLLVLDGYEEVEVELEDIDMEKVEAIEDIEFRETFKQQCEQEWDRQRKEHAKQEKAEAKAAAKQAKKEAKQAKRAAKQAKAEAKAEAKKAKVDGKKPQASRADDGDEAPLPTSSPKALGVLGLNNKDGAVENSTGKESSKKSKSFHNIKKLFSANKSTTDVTNAKGKTIGEPMPIPHATAGSAGVSSGSRDVMIGIKASEIGRDDGFYSTNKSDDGDNGTSIKSSDYSGDEARVQYAKALRFMPHTARTIDIPMRGSQNIDSNIEDEGANDDGTECSTEAVAATSERDQDSAEEKSSIDDLKEKKDVVNFSKPLGYNTAVDPTAGMGMMERMQYMKAKAPGSAPIRPVTRDTALSSNAPTEEEKAYARGLTERNKVDREQREGDEAEKKPPSKGFAHTVGASIKGLSGGRPKGDKGNLTARAQLEDY